ncbi:ATP-binding cassette domain-containing protein [Streptomyces smyrnaeus]|uniref:ATP-binding cassette domain-containing protein n=1 Tax=Streptomyces smyrnaeus TaxID=1387713 RepID=UPI003790B07F
MKVYGSGDAEVRALDGVTLGFGTGRFTAIMGPSGSGKSTLMHCAAGLDTLTSGPVTRVAKVPLTACRPWARRAARGCSRAVRRRGASTRPRRSRPGRSAGRAGRAGCRCRPVPCAAALPRRRGGRGGRAGRCAAGRRRPR